MIHFLRQVLDSTTVDGFRARLAAADWQDGRVTAGHQAMNVKRNLQLTEEHPLARELGLIIQQQLARSPAFTAAALPLKIFPPLFNRYEGGGHFGAHIDTAVRMTNQAPWRVRTDLSATLFLAHPDEYDGGELCIRDTYGEQRVKLPAGDLLLYPATSLHEVRPVTRGARLAAFFWVQSMIRDDGQRALLHDLDRAVQSIAADHPGHSSVDQLTGVYHNLLRRWAEL